jgi:hypothetical protein
MPLAITSDFSGDWIGRFILRTMEGFDGLTHNLFRVETGINEKRALTKIDYTQEPRADAADPTFAGDFNLTERSLAPVKYVVANTKFDPAALENHWIAERFLRGEPFVEWPVQMQMDFMALIAGTHANWLNRQIWSGDTAGSAPNNIFDGFIKQALADATVIDVATPAALTLANIEAKLNDTWRAIPEIVRQDPNCRIKLSYSAWRLYGDSERAKTTKGIDSYQNDPTIFKGIRLVPCYGMPANTMIGCVDGPGPTGNLFMGLGYDPDSMDTLVIDKVSNSSREWFVQLRAKASVNYAKGNELVLYHFV